VQIFKHISIYPESGPQKRIDDILKRYQGGGHQGAGGAITILSELSVEHMIHRVAQKKVGIHAKFNNLLKSSAVDCGLNKEGQLVRLDEVFLSTGNVGDNAYLRYYENPSTNQKYFKRSKEIEDNFVSEEEMLRESATSYTKRGKERFYPYSKTGVASVSVPELELDTDRIVKEVIDCTGGKKPVMSSIPYGYMELGKKKEKQTYKSYFTDTYEKQDPSIINKLRNLVQRGTLTNRIKAFLNDKNQPATLKRKIRKLVLRSKTDKVSPRQRYIDQILDIYSDDFDKQTLERMKTDVLAEFHAALTSDLGKDIKVDNIV